MDAYCGPYCEHNAHGECGCGPCTFIRSEAVFEHAPGCPQGLLEVMRTQPGAWYVNDLMTAAKRGPGTIYVTLAYLEGSGQVTSEWEPSTEDGPLRRLYSVAEGNER
jgi:hypothetical protein